MEEYHEQEQQVPQGIIGFTFHPYDSGREKGIVRCGISVPRQQFQLENTFYYDNYLKKAQVT